MAEVVKSNLVKFPKSQQRPITSFTRYIPNGILNNSEHKLLLILSTYANQDDKCWPSLAALAEDYYGNPASEVPETLFLKRQKNISMYLQRLKDAKLITISKQGTKNIYTFNRILLNAYDEMRRVSNANIPQ